MVKEEGEESDEDEDDSDDSDDDDEVQSLDHAAASKNMRYEDLVNKYLGKGKKKGKEKKLSS